METDSFFCQLFKQVPETLFELLGLPAERAHAYHFDSVELKKSLRIDGLFLPTESGLPLYFVEVQFQRSAYFYANFFAKVFSFLEENDPGHDWAAVAIFATRQVEPTRLGPYEELVQSRRVTRIYLDEYVMPADPPVGLSLVQLVSAPESDVKNLVGRMIDKTEHEIADSDLAKKVLELAEGLLLRRFTQLDREEVRMMFQLQDIRKSKVWQEAHEKGLEEGRVLEQRELVRKKLAKGMSLEAIADLMELSVDDVRRLAKEKAT